MYLYKLMVVLKFELFERHFNKLFFLFFTSNFLPIFMGQMAVRVGLNNVFVCVSCDHFKDDTTFGIQNLWKSLFYFFNYVSNVHAYRRLIYFSY